MAIIKRTPRPGELTRGAKHSRFLVFDSDGRPVASSSKASDFARWPSNPHVGDTIVYGESGPEWNSDETPFNPNATYPNLTAGKANEAPYISSDREIDDTSGACPPSTFGPTGGTAEVASGYVALTEILGNTVVDGGELKHAKSKYIKSVGRNQWDEEILANSYLTETGDVHSYNGAITSKNYIRAFPSEEYYIISPASGIRVNFYDASMNVLDTATYAESHSFTTPAGCMYIRFSIFNYGSSTYNNDVCVYIYYNTLLPYVSYWEDVIQLPDIEVKSAGSGASVVRDVLYQTGGGKQKVGSYTFTGSEEWTFYSEGSSFWYTVMSGVANGYICPASNGVVIQSASDILRVYTNSNPTITSESDLNEIFPEGTEVTFVLTTPVDIVSDGWTEKLRVDNFGTLQFLDEDENEVAVAQAYNIYYTVNLVEYLDSAYVYTDGDPSNLMLKSDNVMPVAPTTDGSYVLTVTVADGTATYTWESGS